MLNHSEAVQLFLKELDRSKFGWEEFKTKLWLDDKITMRQEINWAFPIDEILKQAEQGSNRGQNLIRPISSPSVAGSLEKGLGVATA